MMRRKKILNNHMKKILVSLAAFYLVFLLVVPAHSQADGALLYLTPSDESHNVGEIFTVALRITSLHQSINAVEGLLKYSNKNVELVNISKTGSILSVWIDGPVFNNDKGEIKFAGGIPSPGFTGAGGILANLTFKAISEGPATIVWNKSSVLANDGKGTNILSSTENGNFIITPNGQLGAGGVVGGLSIKWLIVLLGAAVFATYFISRLWIGKKHLKEDFKHFEREVKEDLRQVESDVEADQLNRDKIESDVKKLGTDLEEEIDEVERKLD